MSTILIKLGSAEVPRTATRIETTHLDIAAYVSDEVVAPGSLFSVVFDITPAKGIHVYAPGAKDYRVINLTLSPDPRLAVRPMEYPAAEVYFFRPLNERVPVFQRAFRLTQRMAVSASPETRKALIGVENLTIQGALDYQACDDRLCFTPQSIPVTFTVKLRPLDTQRATVPK